MNDLNERAISLLTFASGCYSIYQQFKPSYGIAGYGYSYSTAKQLALQAATASLSLAAVVAGSWGVISGTNILNSSAGIGLITGVTTFPFYAIAVQKAHDSRGRGDSDDDGYLVGVSATSSAATGIAAALAADSANLDSNTKVASLAANATFPALVTLFMLIRNNESNLVTTAKTAAASAVTAALAVKAFGPKP